ncbi:hypothetical protein [Ligilactobacillus salivarius]|uniref:hypothetical protein n=1 Tax=Ligilactobacillus salivarius TaxID=1624 RepID=UPI00237ECEA5|nr:hypothetical protein [Ligilactobacillus salivarius]MDE1525064.1 hypothetical protein [Ligilactobacillus salivarius]
MVNPNIERMITELKREFSENAYQEIDLIIYDCHKNNYFLDDEFQEKMFRNLFINYKTSMIEISSDKYNVFDIHTSILIEQEELAVIGKVISIVVKHLSKIEFEEE